MARPDNVTKLEASFFQRQDVVKVAKELLGKVLVTQFNNQLTSGIIVETEAYAGIQDKASHAYGGRRTPRTETMYAKGGTAYVYLCYGIHHLFNIVTNTENVPHAVLIRALEPLEGLGLMMTRRRKEKLDYTLTRGPGSLAQALGIHTRHSGLPLNNEIYVEDRSIIIPKENVSKGARIGVGYAAEDALLPYRFWVKGNSYVSANK